MADPPRKREGHSITGAPAKAAVETKKRKRGRRGRGPVRRRAAVARRIRAGETPIEILESKVRDTTPPERKITVAREVREDAWSTREPGPGAEALKVPVNTEPVAEALAAYYEEHRSRRGAR